MENLIEKKLQNLLFPKPEICPEENLYFRRYGTSIYLYAIDHINLMDETALVEFDTFFNSFSLEKWTKYTLIDNIGLSLDLQGKFLVTVVRKYRTGRGREVLTEVLSEQIVETWQRKHVKIPINFKHTVGSICFKLLSLDFNCIFFGGYYYTEVQSKDIRDVKIGLNICTYRREPFVRNNLLKISDAFFSQHNTEMFNRCEVFVTDNARSLKDEFKNKKIHVFPNKNAGGSGGFTRGLIEILKRKETDGFTHALFMDDDIILDPEVVFRTYSILSLCREKYANAFVGGTMLRLDHQYRCHETGGYWQSGAIHSLKKGLDFREFECCLYGECEETTNYNAWWYCAVPLSLANENNLPLPIFIKADDVEYGLRNMRQIILMNGIAVWHEPFENKYSSMQWYYILRNQCIVNAIHSLFNKKQFFAEFRNTVIREILWYRYKNAELIMRGVEDFLKGIDWLKEQDGEALNADIIKNGYRLDYIDDLPVPFSYSEYDRMLKIKDSSKLKKMVRLLTFNGLILKPNRAFSYAPAEGARVIQFYRAARVLNYDNFSHKGFVTEKDTKKTVSLLWKYFCLKTKFKRKYRKVIRGFRENYGQITNISFWQNYLGIQK